MIEHTFHSSGPVRAETLLVGAWSEGPLGRQFTTAEREVLWLREEAAEVAYFWDGEAFDGIGSWCRIQSACTSGQETAERRKLTPADRLEVRITARFTEQPVERVLSPYSRCEPAYRRLAHLFAGTAEVLAKVAAFDYYSDDWESGDWQPIDARLEPRTLAEAVVWSSKRTEAENAAALVEFLAPFTEAQPCP